MGIGFFLAVATLLSIAGVNMDWELKMCQYTPKMFNDDIISLLEFKKNIEILIYNVWEVILNSGNQWGGGWKNVLTNKYLFDFLVFFMLINLYYLSLSIKISVINTTALFELETYLDDCGVRKILREKNNKEIISKVNWLLLDFDLYLIFLKKL